MSRIVSWFSCGAASAVATKIALDSLRRDIQAHRESPHSNEEDLVAMENRFIIATCVVENEHPDNERFLKDCENWYGKKILRLRSKKYNDCWEVWEQTKYLVGVKGARCTTEMKKLVRQEFQSIRDTQIFGFTIEEQNRADRFKQQNPEVNLDVPLIRKGLTKEDCFSVLKNAKIELPTMYKLGYKNNNCIGCVKGGAGYWNKIRVDFPDVFKRMSELERKLGRTILKVKGKRTYLDELDSNAGHKMKEPDIECGLWCKGDK